MLGKYSCSSTALRVFYNHTLFKFYYLPKELANKHTHSKTNFFVFSFQPTSDHPELKVPYEELWKYRNGYEVAFKPDLEPLMYAKHFSINLYKQDESNKHRILIEKKANSEFTEIKLKGHSKHTQYSYNVLLNASETLVMRQIVKFAQADIYDWKPFANRVYKIQKEDGQIREVSFENEIVEDFQTIQQAKQKQLINMIRNR